MVTPAENHSDRIFVVYDPGGEHVLDLLVPLWVLQLLGSGAVISGVGLLNAFECCSIRLTPYGRELIFSSREK